MCVYIARFTRQMVYDYVQLCAKDFYEYVALNEVMDTHCVCVCVLAVHHASSEPCYPQSTGISGSTQSPSVLL